jgi:hypothetical protein
MDDDELDYQNELPSADPFDIGAYDDSYLEDDWAAAVEDEEQGE